MSNPIQVVAPVVGNIKNNKAAERLAKRVAIQKAVEAVNNGAIAIRAHGSGLVKGIRKAGPQATDTSAVLFAYLAEASRRKTAVVYADGKANEVPSLSHLFGQGHELAKASARAQVIELGAGTQLWFKLGNQFDAAPNVVVSTEVAKTGEMWLVARISAVYRKAPLFGTVRLKCLTCQPKEAKAKAKGKAVAA